MRQTVSRLVNETVATPVLVLKILVFAIQIYESINLIFSIE